MRYTCLDLTGNRYGRLVAIEIVGRGRDGSAVWRCKCDCGNETTALSCKLRCGDVKSCGCLVKDRNKELHTKHGLHGTRLYNEYDKMKCRCYYQNDKQYHNYGGRGITMCEEWLNDKTTFFKWALENGYSDDLSLDRIDSNGNYSPENCRWISMFDQQSNRRNNKILEYKGEKKTMAQWCRDLNLDYRLVKRRILKGWSVEDAFETKVGEVRESLKSI